MLGMTPHEPNLARAMKASLEAVRVYVEGLADDKKIAKSHARYIRRFYEALLEEGFSEEQAVRIAASAPAPGAR